MTRDGTQVVLLAGGLGTRLGDAGRQCPKVLQPVRGRPFLDIMLRPLLDQGFRRFCFCLGHRADQVVAHLHRHWGWLRLSVHVDAEPPGTGGSLLAARALLDETFLVVMGDTYLDIEYRDLLDGLAPEALGIMAVTDAVTEVPGNVEFEAGRVIRYDKALGPRTRWVDTGALALRRRALNLLAGAPHPVDLGRLFERMIARDALLAYPVDRAFYDIGTPQRLDHFAASLAGNPLPG
jgi:NDP-sugar pyrophosphorylase family protein